MHGHMNVKLVLQTVQKCGKPVAVSSVKESDLHLYAAIAPPSCSDTQFTLYSRIQ
jgi:hypothetical protein